MKAIAFATIITAMLVPDLALAHDGHGAVNAQSFAHTLIDHGAAIVFAAAFALASLIETRRVRVKS